MGAYRKASAARAMTAMTVNTFLFIDLEILFILSDYADILSVHRSDRRL